MPKCFSLAIKPLCQISSKALVISQKTVRFFILLCVLFYSYVLFLFYLFIYLLVYLYIINLFINLFAFLQRLQKGVVHVNKLTDWHVFSCKSRLKRSNNIMLW